MRDFFSIGSFFLMKDFFSIGSFFLMKRFGLCFFVVFQVEVDDGFDAFLPEVYWHVFVGGVDGVGFQTEAHEEALYAEFFLEAEMIGMLPPMRMGNGRLPNTCSKPRSAALYAGKSMGQT